ncbi:MAG: pyrimidine 5'-nucleotidase [Kiloniellales bacterium]|nr:pyrimidine 5'-nucleotidase [Kiloniellales bacterium]
MTTPLDIAAGRGRPAPRTEEVEVWLFDLDNTLYPPSSRLFDQVDRRIKAFVQDFLGLDLEAAHRLQKDYFHEFGTTMRGLMTNHGMEPEGYLDYVHDIDLSPIAPAPGLDATLDRLPGRKLIFTNASTPYAERVLDRLGLRRHFEAIFDIAAADYEGKPHPGAYHKLIAQHEVAPERSVFLDDIARNLEPAAALGITTVWVAHDDHRARHGAEGDHVHHVTEDLAAFLRTVLGP